MIAVVGGRGVIGGAIVDRLRAAGADVVVVTHDAAQARRPGFRRGDLLDPATLDAAVEGADVVVQSANFPTYPFEKTRRGQTFMAYDGEGAEHLVAASQRAGARRFVFVSGCGTRNGSTKPYFQALQRGERAVLESGLEAVCIEPTLVFGPRDRGLNKILAFARRSPVVPLLGHGDQLHQPVFVEDVAEVVAQAVEPGSPQGAYELGGPERFSLREMLTRLFAHVGIRRRLAPVPVALARTGAAVLEQLPGQPITPRAVDFGVEPFVADNEPLLGSFDVRLTQFEDGLGRYLAPADSRSR